MSPALQAASLPAEPSGSMQGSCQLGPSLVAQMVKNLPAVQETWVQSLGREDPLEQGMATHSNTLAWRILGQRSLVSTVRGVAKNRI